MQNNHLLAADVIESLKDQLAIRPDNLDVLIKLSQAMLDNKNFAEAEQYLQRIANIAPNNAKILLFLGDTCCQQKKFQQAIYWYENSIAIDPTNITTYIALAKTNHQIGNLSAAITNYKQALQLNPTKQERIQCYNALGIIAIIENETTLALFYFEQLLTIEPLNEIALINMASAFIKINEFNKAKNLLAKIPTNSKLYDLCVVQKSKLLKATGEITKAINYLEQYLNTNKQANIAIYIHLGEYLQIIKNNTKAEAIYNLALQLDPNNWNALSNLINLSMAKKDFTTSKKLIDKILQLKPNYHEAYLILANICMQENNLDGVINCTDIAILLEPKTISAYLLAAEVYLKQYFENGYTDKTLEQKAIELYLKALEISPNDPTITTRIGYVKRLETSELELKLLAASLQNLFQSYQELSNKDTEPLYFTQAQASALAAYANICVANLAWDKLNSIKPILLKVVNDQLLENHTSCLPVFVSQYLLTDINLQSEIAKSYARNYTDKNKYHSYHKANNKLKIAYISPDFNNHVVGFLIGNLFSYHDRNNFEIYGYALRQKYDEQRTLIANSCDYFKDLTELTSKEAAELIYKDKIDILIDLAGYTTGCRPDILNLQPAPIQAHFIGQIGTMGSEFIQYHLATKEIIPEAHLPYYTEQIVYLPDTIIAIEQHNIPALPTKAAYGLPENSIIFCCFNNHYRINEEVFNCWMEILKAVPNSVLWLSTNKETNSNILYNAAKKRQVNPERLIFKPKTILNGDWHHRLADLYLDTFTIAAGTSSILSAWAGLPVLTLAGNTPAARFGVSIMHAAGIPEMVANSKEEYRNLAIEFATNPSKLAAVKQKLLTKKLHSPLFNQKLFIKHLEHAYQLMYLDHKNQTKNKTITVDRLP